jgi:ketosteroid isomerase-like protein
LTLPAAADSVIKATGRSMDLQVCHVWKLRDGRITSYQQYLDTGKLQGAMGVRPDAAVAAA